MTTRGPPLPPPNSWEWRRATQSGGRYGRSASAARRSRSVKGHTLSEFAGETLLGHVGDDEVLLVRSGSEIFAIGAHCSHYHGPLAEGLVTGEGIRCPWHHACFDLRTGEATRAPALSPIAVWKVEQEDGRIFVREKREQPKPAGEGRHRCARPES